MITRKEIDLAAPLTTPQIEMLTALAASPSTADVYCPELTAAQQKKFLSAHPQNGFPLHLR